MRTLFYLDSRRGGLEISKTQEFTVSTSVFFLFVLLRQVSGSSGWSQAHYVAEVGLSSQHSCLCPLSDGILGMWYHTPLIVRVFKSLSIRVLLKSLTQPWTKALRSRLNCVKRLWRRCIGSWPASCTNNDNHLCLCDCNDAEGVNPGFSYLLAVWLSQSSPLCVLFSLTYVRENQALPRAELGLPAIRALDCHP